MSSTHSAFAAVAMAALLVLAGCAGPAATGTDAPAEGETGETVTPSNGASVSGEGGVVEFYISDEENAIEDFEHLNVTVTKVGFHRVDDAEDGQASETEDADSEDTATATNGTPEGATPTATLTPTEDGEQDQEGEADDEEGEEEGEESEEEGEEGEDEGEEGDGEWVEYEVTRTVDLTELQGANASSLGELAAPNGTYDKVFVYVDGINATLKNGESVNVKLPSNKLQLNKQFTVGDGERVQFVFDISVHKAGKSGKYILKPTVGESGTGDEVEIDDVDEDEDERDEGEADESEEDEAEEDESEETEAPEDAEENETEEPEAETEEPEETEAPAADLSAEFQGPVKAGQETTLKVTGDDGPVANATVEVNGEFVGETAADGTLTFTVPEDAETLEVAVTKGEAELEFERDLQGGGSLLLAAPA